MKTVIIGDLHIGIRNGNQYFFRMMKNFFEEKFFPFLYENNITRVIQLGDILDKRKSIDFTVAKFLRDDFLRKFDESKIELYAISGNHDLYYRQSVSIDGPSQFTNGYQYVKIIKEPMVLDDFLLIPWVCDENKQNIVDFLEKNRNPQKIVLGHFELAGFPVIKGHMAERGSLENDIFSGYKKVISGHYHSPSSRKNIVYIGTPYELSWNETGDEKKYYVYDDETTEIVPIYTNQRLFIQVDWYKRDDYNLEFFKDKYIRLLIDEETDENILSLYLSEIDKIGVADIKVLRKDIVDNAKEQEEVTQVDDILSIMMTYIDENFKNSDSECTLTKEITTSIYKQAQESQV